MLNARRQNINNLVLNIGSYMKPLKVFQFIKSCGYNGVLFYFDIMSLNVLQWSHDEMTCHNVTVVEIVMR